MQYSHNKETLFKQIDGASFVTLIGSSGSGKSQLVAAYLDYVTTKFEPQEFGINAYDITRVEYYEGDPIYPWVNEHRLSNAEQVVGLNEDLATVNKRIVANHKLHRKIFIHITECDIMASDHKEQMLDLCELVAKHGQDIHVQLLYETSRPSVNAMPPALSKQSDLRIMAHTPVLSDIGHFMPECNAAVDLVDEGRKYMVCDDSGQLRGYHLLLY